MASLSAYGVSNQQIADQLNISRQAVTRHRKRGMPCSSLPDALAWYGRHVDASRRRGTFSILPRRVFAPSFDPECDRIIGQIEGNEQEPEPVRLDYFAKDFWGDSATASILNILGGGSTKAFRHRENVIAAFFCIFAGMRLHLRLMPQMMARRMVKKRTVEQVEAELMEWSCAFASRWFGKDFEKEPILPTNINALREFYRALDK
jgi:hypothetical protein